ncbi:MAG: hypothetical protein HY023_19240 [Chloroflexi bacterium]|nr:hypothetical protein [Chloroflexota bacterium]MBI3762102.1 hypothetical protein [Chloroflexota bacterium]
MDWLASLAAVAALFALRLGVPLLITILVGHMLSRLDAKWQAREQERLMHDSSPAPEIPSCWEIRGCDPAQREKCPAYGLRPLPCWLAWRRLTGRVPECCFDCEVFLTA